MESNESLIFVSIASYRDAQLIPTIEDCIAKANDPAGLRFGICWQHDTTEPLLPYLDDPRFRILDVDWRESRGACWARAAIMRLWEGEDWFLQVDSHCRFAQGWDEKLLRTVIETGSAKPIVSTYATDFTPGEQERLLDSPMQIALQGFDPDGLPRLRPAPFFGTRWPPGPVRARFLSAGFLFTIGDFIEDVPYDPELYFMGEEASMTVRAFTHGYDLFHPNRTLVWHDYIRKDAKRHWGDHSEPAAADGRTLHRSRPSWTDLDQPSRRKVSRMLQGEPLASFGLGNERTLSDYEAYAGLSFARRRAQQYTIHAEEPPNPPVAADWADTIYPWIAKVTVKRTEMPPEAFADPQMWALSIYDERAIEIYRQDFIASELAALRGDEPEVVLVVEFISGIAPASWALSPMSRSRGWLPRMTGALQDGDFALLDETAEEEKSEAER